MTIFWSSIAIALVLAWITWVLGRRPLRPLKPAKDRYNWFYIFLIAIPMATQVNEGLQDWNALGDALGMMTSAASADIPGYVAKAKAARTNLVFDVVAITALASFVVVCVVKDAKILLSRLSRKSITIKQEAI